MQVDAASMGGVDEYIRRIRDEMFTGLRLSPADRESLGMRQAGGACLYGPPGDQPPFLCLCCLFSLNHGRNSVTTYPPIHNPHVHLCIASGLRYELGLYNTTLNPEATQPLRLWSHPESGFLHASGFGTLSHPKRCQTSGSTHAAAVASLSAQLELTSQYIADILPSFKTLSTPHSINHINTLTEVQWHVAEHIIFQSALDCIKQRQRL